MPEEKESSRFESGQEESTPRRGLRASNTTATLQPREVNVEFHTENEPPVTLPAHSGSTLKVIQKTDTLQGRGLPPEAFNLTPVSWPDAKATPDAKEKIFRPSAVQGQGQAGKLAEPVKVSIPRPKPSYVPTQAPMASRVDDLEAKVEKLEGQVDDILDRLAKFSIRSSHKI